MRAQAKIRPIRAGDADDLACMAVALNGELGNESTPFTGTSLIPMLTGSDPFLAGFIAVDEGERPVGYALSQKFFDTDTGTMSTWLLDLYVDPALRKAGLGRRLLVAVAADAVSRGHRCLSLAVYGDNPARRLYERAGAGEDRELLAFELRGAKLEALAREG